MSIDGEQKTASCVFIPVNGRKSFMYPTSAKELMLKASARLVLHTLSFNSFLDQFIHTASCAWKNQELP